MRWLRPAFQHPQAESAPQQTEIETTDATATATQPAARKPRPWPRDAIDQVRAVATVLAASATPLSVDDIAAHFSARGAWKKRLPPLLNMLAALGRASSYQNAVSAGRSPRAGKW